MNNYIKEKDMDDYKKKNLYQCDECGDSFRYRVNYNNHPCVKNKTKE